MAELYDAVRPGYPQELFDDLRAAAGVDPGSSVLEIGCGTGIATRSLARWGSRVVALDPGAELLRVGRRRLAGRGNVELVHSSFEAWDPGGASFALVVAAQSFHWVDPEVRFEKTADLLAPGGLLAVFGNVPLPLPSPLREAVGDCYARYAPHLAGPSPESWYLPEGPLAGSFAESARYLPAEHRRYAWSRRLSAGDYVRLLESLSGHQLLDADARAGLLGGVGAAVESAGGDLRLGYETHLHLARPS